MVQYRLARLESLLKEEIADIIKRDIREVDFGLTSITKIIISRDLHLAKVYVSIYGDDAKQNSIMQKLRASSRLVRKGIGSRIRLRYTPEIEFIQDNSMEEAIQIFKIMQDIKKKSAKRDIPSTKQK
jgi:ribosome-binding factor A